jgi:hypothetical protein
MRKSYDPEIKIKDTMIGNIISIKYEIKEKN